MYINKKINIFIICKFNYIYFNKKYNFIALKS